MFSFLRWTLNSLPTASRLHDDGHSSCPFCGSLDAKTSHLAECNVGISAVTSFMYCGQVQTTNVFVPFLSSFVMRRSGRADWTCIASSFTKETDHPHPLPFSWHLRIFLGMQSQSNSELECYWRRLYLLQQAFTSLRAAEATLDLNSEAGANALRGHFRSAQLSMTS